MRMWRADKRMGWEDMDDYDELSEERKCFI